MSKSAIEERHRKEIVILAQYGSDAPAAREFNRARKRSFLNDIDAFLHGYTNRLLSFDEVSQSVATGQLIDHGLQDVPLDAIRGSVDRYRDFDLAFLPRRGGLRDRWSRVAVARSHGLPMPPVDLYKLGDVYFVRDGNHRVSVARSRGDRSIHAYVIEMVTRIPICPDLTPDDLPSIEAYADFLRLTEADLHLPGVDLWLTQPRNYARLLRHIALFRYLNRQPGEEPREWPEAVRAWYDQLYQPFLAIIHDSGVMDHFPTRTPTDLYMWLVTHFRQLHSHLPRPSEFTEIEENLHLYLAPYLDL